MNVFPSFVQAHPNFMMPEIVLQYQQASGFTESLAGGEVQPRLGEGDLSVYAKTLQLRTQVAGGQTAYNKLPSVSLVAGQVATPTYLWRIRAEYDHHDTQQAGVWGVALSEAQRLGMRQGIFQQVRTTALFGSGASGEGLMNTAGATTVNLPADSYGNTSISTYDNGQMALFLLGQIGTLKTRVNLIGKGCRINILAPQRVIQSWDYQGVVQLTQYQRAGAGVATTAEMVAEVAKRQGDNVTFTCDDTLIGAGSGGGDAIIINMPEVTKPPSQNRVDTNVFAGLQPSQTAAALQLCDMVAPREITTPLPGGAVDVVSELRATSGWGLRPETITIVSATY